MYQYIDDDPKVDIVLEKSGRTLRVEEYMVDTSFLGSTDSFSFTYYSEDQDNLRGLELQPVTIKINDRPQVVGRIDKTSRGESGSAVACEGRDYISDLVECNVDPKFILKTGMGLIDAMIQLCSPCGITSVIAPGLRSEVRTGKSTPGTRTLHPLTQKQINDIGKERSGRGIYEIGEELMARYGLFIQPAASRESIVIQVPTYDGESLGCITRTTGGGQHNLVISAKADRDYSMVPTHTMFTGRQGAAVERGGNKGTLATWTTWDYLDLFPVEFRKIVEDAVSQGRNEPGVTQVADGTLYRLLYHKDDSVGKTQEQIQHSLKRALSDRLKNTLVYSCMVRGHVNPATGYTWAIDNLIDVDDDMSDVHETLWCHKCTFANSRKNGPTTRLEMLRPSAFNTYWAI